MDYFRLKANDQRDIIGTASSITGRAENVIEKDIWLCLVLRELFAMPNAKPMAFKGGTSLSKVYSVINRFSEDVDVTIDYRSFSPDAQLDHLALTSNRIKDQLTETLRSEVKDYVHGVVAPYLETQLSTLGMTQPCTLIVDECGEKIEVGYPSLYAHADGYLRQHVLVEFGGRNIIDPNETCSIEPDLAAQFSAVIFPKASVVVLKAERTFWEKATLIHAACKKGIKADRNRDSRHWYDLAMLATHEIGARAKQDRMLAADVVNLKKVFYRQGTAEYDACLRGGLTLIPDGDNLARLRADYEQMIKSGMMDGNIMPMDLILEVLASLEAEINAAGQFSFP